VTAIGIDLGTTNSVVATYDPERARTRVVTVGGARSTPSAVSIKREDGKDDELLVGQNAINWANADPENTILSVKRLMGRDYADQEVEAARRRRSYRIVPGPDEDPRAHVIIGDTTYTPADVSTFILERLRNGAAQTLDAHVSHAVITVPAYFEEAQRTATREAGEQAGLVVKRIIDEPTAAAIAFGLELGEHDRRRVLVYDLGGGTFDISVLNATRDKQGHPHFQVMQFTGDNWLGGDDFDALIVDRIIDWVRTSAGVDPTGDAEFMFRAKDAAEKAKVFLSDNASANIVIPYAHKTPDGFIDVTMSLSRDEFDALIEQLVERTIGLVRAVLDRQNLTSADITDVLLVGGATLTPKVYETVEEFFGRGKVRRNIDPMECVAIGAGILANTLHGVECQACKKVNDESADTCAGCEHSLVNARSVGDTNVHDVTGMALGVRAVKGSHRDEFVTIIPPGTPYPMGEPLRHSFGATDGRLIRVPVYEGDSTLASKNREQGVIEFELQDEIDVHSRVDVAFMFDRNRELHVTISVPGTGNEYRKKLRFDAPRTDLGPATSPPESEDEDTTYRTKLTIAREMTLQFLNDYGQYLQPAQEMKVRKDLDDTAQILMFAEPAECRRMIAILDSDMFNSGLASSLHLADRVAERATGTDARQLTDSIDSVRQAFRDGKHEVVHEQARVLKVLVASRLYREDVPEIPDAEDFAGLLKLLES
jgi:molecular chaperone DnaK (HSP70)